MFGLNLTDPRSKPEFGAELDRSHPLVPGVGYWIFNESGGPTVYDLVAGYKGTLSAGATWSGGWDGAALTFNGTSGDVSVTGVPNFGNAMTIVASVKSVSYAGNMMIAERSNVNTAWELFFGTGVLDWRGGNSADRVTSTLANAGIVDGKPYIIGATDNGAAPGSASLWVNGRSVATGSAGSPPANNTNAIHIGNYDNSAYFFSGFIDWVYIDNKVRSPGDMAWLAAEPFAFILPPATRRYFLVSSGPPSFSYSPSGGIVLGGTASPSVTFSPAPSGGLVLGGTSTPTASFNPSPSGGLVLGGTAGTPGLTFSYTASGGIILGGTAPGSSSGGSFSYSPSGGIVLGGTSGAPGVTFSPLPSGGLTLGGTATANFVATAAPPPNLYLSPFWWFAYSTAGAGLPPNLLAAIVARAKATPALIGALPGGFWVGLVPDLQPYPNASLVDLTGPRTGWDTGGSQIQTRLLQVTFFVAGQNPEGDARDLVELWDDTFRPLMAPPLVYQGIRGKGYVTRCATSNDFLVVTEAIAPDGTRLHQQVVEFTCLVGRNVSP